MKDLAELYGNDFDSVWHEALTSGYSSRSMARSTTGTLFKLQTHEGVVDYLALQTLVQSPFPLELTIHMPLGESSFERHRRLLDNIDMSRASFDVRAGRMP